MGPGAPIKVLELYNVFHFTAYMYLYIFSFFTNYAISPYLLTFLTKSFGFVEIHIQKYTFFTFLTTSGMM